MFEAMHEYAISKLPDLYQVLIYHEDNELYNRIFQQYGYPDYMVNFKSVSKFLFALAVGCMIDDGVIRDASVPVAELLPEYALQMPVVFRKTLCLYHLLSMSSGFQWSDSGNVFFEWMHSKDWVRFALTRPIDGVPGERYCYNTSNIHLVSAIIREKTGMPALQYIKERLLLPLGIYHIVGQCSPEGNDFGGSELYLAPQDMAKIGRLVLQNGVWKKRILSSEWISLCLKEHMRVNEEYGYGYCCFLTEMPISRGSLEKATVCIVPGTGGQYMYLCPSLCLVVVIASVLKPRDGRNPLHIPEAKLMPDYIFYEVVNEGRGGHG